MSRLDWMSEIAMDIQSNIREAVSDQAHEYARVHNLYNDAEAERLRAENKKLKLENQEAVKFISELLELVEELKCQQRQSK